MANLVSVCIVVLSVRRSVLEVHVDVVVNMAMTLLLFSKLQSVNVTEKPACMSACMRTQCSRSCANVGNVCRARDCVFMYCSLFGECCLVVWCVLRVACGVVIVLVCCCVVVCVVVSCCVVLLRRCCVVFALLLRCCRCCCVAVLLCCCVFISVVVALWCCGIGGVVAVVAVDAVLLARDGLDERL